MLIVVGIDRNAASFVFHDIHKALSASQSPSTLEEQNSIYDLESGEGDEILDSDLYARGPTAFVTSIGASDCNSLPSTMKTIINGFVQQSSDWAPAECEYSCLTINLKSDGPS